MTSPDDLYPVDMHGGSQKLTVLSPYGRTVPAATSTRFPHAAHGPATRLRGADVPPCGDMGPEGLALKSNDP